MTAKLETQVRREQIALATLEIAATGGLRKLTVAAVARRVGLVPSALYRHFKSMDEIVDATLDLIQDKLLENVKAVRGQSADALVRLQRLLMCHVGLILKNRGIPQVIFSQDLYVGHEERRRRLYRGIRRYLAEVATIIREAKEAGQVGRRIDPDVAAVMFLGLIQPSAILWHMSDGDFDVARQAKRAWPLFRRAIEYQDAEA